MAAHLQSRTCRCIVTCPLANSVRHFQFEQDSSLGSTLQEVEFSWSRSDPSLPHDLASCLALHKHDDKKKVLHYPMINKVAIYKILKHRSDFNMTNSSNWTWRFYLLLSVDWKEQTVSVGQEMILKLDSSPQSFNSPQIFLGCVGQSSLILGVRWRS